MRYPAQAQIPILLVVSLCMASAQAAEEKQTVSAVWKPQEIAFFYQSFSTFYSCHALEERLKRILQAVGAEEINARASGCISNAPVRSPHVRLTFKSPVEATAETLEDLKKGATQRELTARVRGERPEEVTAQFPAEWRTVHLSTGHLGIDPGECELIEAINKTILPRLAVRVVEESLSCTPNTRTLSRPRLEVRALVAAPKPDDARSNGG